MEAAARLLREAGVPLVDPSAAAPTSYLVNTCTVTSTADEKSRAAVRRARRANPDAQVVVTGCSVQVGPGGVRGGRPGGPPRRQRRQGRVPRRARGAASPRRRRRTARSTAPLPDAVRASRRSPRRRIDGVADDRASVERTRAFVKVQDGCSFFCTYCIIPRARGAERSLAPERVLADVRRALAAGHREIVLTGINIGTYDGGWSERGHRGSHTASALTLAGLVRRILDETPVERIRLSSIEPQHVDDELLATWVDGAPRTLPHLHLPLQSGDDGVLRRMGRRYLTADYARGRRAGPRRRSRASPSTPTSSPASRPRTTPRSTGRCAFIEGLDLAGLHVFRYSARPGHARRRAWPARSPEPVKKARAAAAPGRTPREGPRSLGPRRPRDDDPRPRGDAPRRRPLGRACGGPRPRRGAGPRRATPTTSRTRSSPSAGPRSTRRLPTASAARIARRRPRPALPSRRPPRPRPPAGAVHA